MAITWTENWSDWTLAKTQRGWTARKSWIGTGWTNEAEAINDPFIPQINAPHELNPAMKARQPQYEKIGPRAIKATVDYAFPEGGSFTAPTNPLNDPILLEWDEIVQEQAFEIDLEGVPLCNSAGDPFERVDTISTFSQILRARRNEPFYNHATARAYTNHVNSNSFTINGPSGLSVGPRQCLLRSYLPVGAHKLDTPYVEVQYTFEIRVYSSSSSTPQFIRDDPFQIYKIDQGQRGYFTNSKGELRRGRLKENGEDVTRDVLLNGIGRPLNNWVTVNGATAIQPPVPFIPLSRVFLADPSDPESVRVLKFLRYHSRDFTGLGLN